jgi:pyridoxal phosphate enzyme (YggS family)
LAKEGGQGDGFDLSSYPPLRWRRGGIKGGEVKVLIKSSISTQTGGKIGVDRRRQTGKVTIRQNVRQILEEVPRGVSVVAAAKTREPREVREAIEAGIKIVGENYVQEAERARGEAGGKVQWHFIGHLQKNKVKRAVEIFDMIETVDSAELAKEIDKRCGLAGKIMPVLIEVNSGREAAKAGVDPEEVEGFTKGIAGLKNIRVAGLMTMGPAVSRPEEARPYFRETKQLFERIKGLNIPDVEMKYLSMGMTDSYRIAIEEGANIIRIGNKIFGERASRPVR